MRSFGCSVIPGFVDISLSVHGCLLRHHSFSFESLLRSSILIRLLYVFLTLAFFVCLMFSFERPAMAYVDPGSGLFLFQTVSSMGVAALFFLRRRIRALFGGIRTLEDPLLRSGAEDASPSVTNAQTGDIKTPKAA